MTKRLTATKIIIRGGLFFVSLLKDFCKLYFKRLGFDCAWINT